MYKMLYLSGYWGIVKVFVITFKEFETCIVVPAIKKRVLGWTLFISVSVILI